MVWIKSRIDDQESSETYLKPDEVKEFKPVQILSIRYRKSQASVLDLTINGRPANVTKESSTNPIEMLITKDDYAKFLQ